MKRILAGLALVVAIGFGAPALSAPWDGQDEGKPADILALRNVEITFHESGSSLPAPSLDRMMSLYADDAELIDTAHGNKSYKGKTQVRAYFAEVAPPFHPGTHWIGYTPAFRIRAKAHGDRATLYFECLWMDADKSAIGVHSFSDMALKRANGRWLVETVRVGKVAGL
jgi:hypothetical protein